MEYSNPPIPDGINNPPDHPLKNLLILLGGALALIVLAVYLLDLAAGYLARHIPFSVEYDLATRVLNAQSPDDKPRENSHTDPALTDYLQSLADRLVPYQNLPEGMTVTVHYSDTEAVNAFATLGGHIFVTRGLLEKIPNENALAMVLGHEIAHVKHRHPIASLGRGVIISLGIATVLGSTGMDSVGGLLNDAGWLTQLSFSRSQERMADSDALTGLVGLYGTGAGATAPFELFDRLQSQNLRVPEFLSTHPLNQARIQALQRQIQEGGATADDTKLKPLPAFVRQALDERTPSAIPLGECDTAEEQ